MSAALDLDALLADPARVADVPPADVPDLLASLVAQEARLSTLKAVLAARLAVPSAPGSLDGERRLLTIPEVAERLNVPTQHAYELARNGLPSVRFGKYVRVRADDLDAWIAQHRDRP